MLLQLLAILARQVPIQIIMHEHDGDVALHISHPFPQRRSDSHNRCFYTVRSVQLRGFTYFDEKYLQLMLQFLPQKLPAAMNAGLYGRYRHIEHIRYFLQR